MGACRSWYAHAQGAHLRVMAMGARQQAATTKRALDTPAVLAPFSIFPGSPSCLCEVRVVAGAPHMR